VGKQEKLKEQGGRTWKIGKHSFGFILEEKFLYKNKKN